MKTYTKCVKDQAAAYKVIDILMDLKIPYQVIEMDGFEFVVSVEYAKNLNIAIHEVSLLKFTHLDGVPWKKNKLIFN